MCISYHLNMSTFISHLQIANATLCLLLALQLFAVPAMRTTPKRILALNWLFYAHQSMGLAAILNGYTLSFGIARPLIAMFFGPIFYIYFLVVQRPDSKLVWRDSVHFLVALLMFFTVFLVKPLRFLIDYLIFLSFLCYTASIVWQIREQIWIRGSQSERALAHLGNHARSAQVWLKGLALLSLINLVLELAVNFELTNGIALRDSYSLAIASLLFLIINAFLMFAALQRTHWLEWMYQFGQVGSDMGAPSSPNDEEHKQIIAPSNTTDMAPTPASTTKTANETGSETLTENENSKVAKPSPTTIEEQKQHQAIFERWEELIQQEQLHKQDFGITLPQAARKLQVPARQLSNAVNQIYGKSFSTHLNDLRIAEAISLLTSEAGMSITEVMHQAGFSSKSNFNKEFLRVTGMSPSAYRETLLKTSSEMNSAAPNAANRSSSFQA